jgi:hypothetical protein
MYLHCASIYMGNRRHYISDDHVEPDASMNHRTPPDIMRMYVSAAGVLVVQCVF